MNAPAHIAAAARARVEERRQQIEDSLRAIAAGRPGDAEPEKTRRAAVLQRRTGMSIGEALSRAPASGAERVWGKTIDFVDVAFLERGARVARAVARVVTRDGQGLGTGFMISPTLFLTNNHVIATPEHADELVIEFDYERDLSGRPRQPTRFALSAAICFVSNHEDDLDYTVVSVGGRLTGSGVLTDYQFVPLSSARDKHQLGDHANIIQHPDGRMKEAVLRENQLVSRASTTLHYVADTEPGSSGSPVFNVLWQVIALHHWGEPHRDLVDQDGRPLAKTINEGIRVSAIVSDLNTRMSGLTASQRRLVVETLAAGLAPEAVPAIGDSQMLWQTRSKSAGVDLSPDGTVTWTIPLRVSMQLEGLPGVRQGVEAYVARPVDKADSTVMPLPGGEARIEIDSDYTSRGGYDPAFLPSYEIPLPTLASEEARTAAAVNSEARRGPEYELPYEHFSVVMNGRRRLAFFTATNINGLTAKAYDRNTGKITAYQPDVGAGERSAETSETWFLDRRIQDYEQTPPGFYGGQTTFDANGDPVEDKRRADHTNRMFQQGHLTRRQDPLWGADETVIRANADTFHVTNRSPQVGFFNMGVRKPLSEAGGHPGGTLHWRALEDFALNNAVADGARVTVFTGPIFDDANDLPWDRGVLGMEGFKAPREYWKVVVRVEDGRLCATALCADQSPLIDYLPEADLSAEALKRVSFDKVRRYHVSIAELEARTLINFGTIVRDADTYADGERREVRTLSEVLAGAPRKLRSAVATPEADPGTARTRANIRK
jgi:endonuclease G